MRLLAAAGAHYAFIDRGGSYVGAGYEKDDGWLYLKFDPLAERSQPGQAIKVKANPKTRGKEKKVAVTRTGMARASRVARLLNFSISNIPSMTWQSYLRWKERSR